MNAEQITNIAIKIGELQQKTNTALWVAVISAGGAIVAAVIAGRLNGRLQVLQQEHQKQWAFINKRTSLIDSAVEISIRMMFNKLLLAYYPAHAEAPINLFVLSKDALSIESQMVVYGSLEIAEAFADSRESILGCPNDQFLKRWDEIYKKGQNYLLLCRKTLGTDIGEPYKEFQRKLQTPPPREQVPTVVTANTMGGLTQQGIKTTDPHD